MKRELREFIRELDINGEIIRKEENSVSIRLNAPSIPQILSYHEETVFERRPSTFQRIKYKMIKEFPCITHIRPRCWFKTAYVDPNIRFRLYPYEISRLKIIILRGKMQGTIVSRFDNQSEEGKECVCKAPFGRCDPITQGTCEYIPGSADLQGNKKLFESYITEEDQQVKYLSLSNVKIPKTSPRRYRYITMEWESSGFGEFIKNIARLVVKGTIKTYNGIDVYINYYWLDSLSTIHKKLRVQVNLPVREVDIDWW